MKFTDLAFLPYCRMNEVYRYSSVYQETNETLSDHVVDVMIMSYIITSTLTKKYGEVFNIGELLQKCLLHDIDEVITGDVPRNTKYATDKVHAELNQVAENAVNMMTTDTGIDIKNIWKSAKSGKEGCILEIVDILSVAKKCITEIELRGNITFIKVVEELSSHLLNIIESVRNSNYFNEESLEWLINLIKDAYASIKLIKDKYSVYADTYHIKENIINY